MQIKIPSIMSLRFCLTCRSVVLDQADIDR